MVATFRHKINLNFVNNAGKMSRWQIIINHLFRPHTSKTQITSDL